MAVEGASQCYPPCQLWGRALSHPPHEGWRDLATSARGFLSTKLLSLIPSWPKPGSSAPSHPWQLPVPAPGPCRGPDPHHIGSDVLTHQSPAFGITAGSPRAGTVPGGRSPAEVKEGPGGGRDALGRPAEEVELRQGAGLLRLHVFQVEAAHQEILTPDVL